MPFSYTSGNPDNLTGGAPARMQDIQGPFYDLRAWLNSSTGGGAAAGGFVDVTAGLSLPVLDVGMLGQVRAGRQLALADFSAMGLSVPVGLWNLGDLTNLGTGGALVNKGAVPFGVGVNGLSTTAAQFSGSTGQALYIADTGAADPFRIKTGSWGCWFRTAKRATYQQLVSKFTAASRGFYLLIANTNVLWTEVGITGADNNQAIGVSDVCDDRWHHAVVTHDGTTQRLYVDGVLEVTLATAGPIFASVAPLNIGGEGADGGTAAGNPHYGRVDEAFVTADVLTDDQIRNLYCAKIAHTLGAAPTRIKLNVRRLRKGAALATTDFPATPIRLHNFTNGALTDQGTGGVALVAVGGGSILNVGGADGVSNNAFSFSGAHTGLGATDAGLPAGTASRSYGCWFKTTSGGAGTLVVLVWGTGGTGHAAIITANGAVATASGADTVTGPYTADGQWHQSIVVEDNASGDGVRRKLYLDGRLVGGSTVLNSIVLAGANRFRVAANGDGTLPFTGQIDAAFVTGSALTMEQVAALYAKGTQSLGPSPKNPGDHVEAFDASAVLCVFDSLDSQHQVDLSVGS